MFKLYYYPNNASLAPHFLLHHVKADYELVWVEKERNTHKSADYLKLNPAGRIPTLVDDEQLVLGRGALLRFECSGQLI